MLNDYASQYFTCGPVYLDPDWAFYKAMGSRTIGLSGFTEYINPLKAIGRIFALREKNIDGTLGGEGQTLGGVMVMAPGASGAAYTYLEETGKVLPSAEIASAVQKVVERRSDAVPSRGGECQASERGDEGEISHP